MISRVVLASFAIAGSIVLTACGGGSEDKAAKAFAQPLRKPLPELCSKGQHDTDAVRYRSLDGVCTAVFAPMADPAAAPQQSAEAGAPQRAAHAPFTWTSFLAWATTAYPVLFRGGFEDGVAGEYTYRYWPLTDHYLAVAGGESLYALGPATDWEIVYIGRLSALLCFVYPANCAAASTDIPGSAATRATLAIGAAATSTIEQQDDEDWFAVDLAAGTTYTFRMEGASTAKGTLRDPSLSLYNVGTRVAYNDDASYPSNLNSQFQYTPATSGRYYLAAGAYQSTGTYEVSVSASGGTGGTGGTGTGGTGTGSTDIRGDTATTAVLVFPSVAASSIERADDQDWFAVDLVAGVAYTFYLEGASTGKGTLSDPYLRLHNAAGTSVASHDDVTYPSNLNARIQYTATTSGRYYVAASAFQSTGSYLLTVSASGGSGTGGTGTGGTGTGGTDGSGTGGTGTGGTGTGGTGTGGTVTTKRLTTSTSGTGQGTVSPASGTTYAPGALVTVSAQPQFFSEFAGWTSQSTGCAGTRYSCQLTMNRDHTMQARFEPAVFVTSFDTNYTTVLANSCNWHVTWSNTRIELTYRLSSGSYVGRIRIKGRRQAVVTREYAGHDCYGSDNNTDVSFDIGRQQAGAGAYARVRSFDGAGDEYLTLSSGGLPGPNGAVAGFVPGQISLAYTGTNRSGSTTLPVIVVTRLHAQ